MKNRITLYLAAMSLLITVGAWAVGVEFFDSTGTIPSKVKAANPLPVTSGSVNTVQGYAGSLATNAAVKLSAIASPSTGDIIELQTKGAAFRGPASWTYTAIQADGILQQANEVFSFRFASGLDLGWTASGSACSFSVLIYKDR